MNSTPDELTGATTKLVTRFGFRERLAGCQPRAL